MKLYFYLFFFLIFIAFNVSNEGIEGIERSLEADKARRWAILIGVNRYDDSAIKSLKYSVADVTAVCQLLSDQKVGGFDKSKVYLLTDDTKLKPTKNNILKSLKFLADAIGSEGSNDKALILIYFSGHGVEEKGKNYLLPKDAALSKLSDTAIPLEKIEGTFAKSNVKRQIQILILDACRSGIGQSQSRSEQLTSSKMSAEFAKGLFIFSKSEKSEGEAKAILSSSSMNESSYEFPHVGHGAFTYYLLEALNGYADFNNDNFITVSETANYVREKVSRWADENRKKQTPVSYLDSSTDIVLTKKRKS